MTGEQVVLVSVLAVVLTIALETNQLALGARPLGTDQKASDPPSVYNAPRVAPKLYYNVSKREVPYSGPSQCSSSIPGVFCPRVPAAAAAVQREININTTIIPRAWGRVEPTYTHEDSRGVSGQSRKPGRKVKISKLE